MRHRPCSWPTFLGTRRRLRQTAIRCLVQLGVDGLELGAQTRLQPASVQEYNSHSANNWIAKEGSEETASVAVKFLATAKWRNVEPG